MDPVSKIQKSHDFPSCGRGKIESPMVLFFEFNKQNMIVCLYHHVK